jgi:hypothetical protein
MNSPVEPVDRVRSRRPALPRLLDKPTEPKAMGEAAEVELLRVVGATHPFEHRVVLGMRRVANGGEEVGVAPHASAVLGGQARRPAMQAG